MNPVSVIYHCDPDGWWADSPAIPGWSATAATLGEMHVLVEEGVRFALDRDDIFVQHLLESQSSTAAVVVFDFVSGRMVIRQTAGNWGHHVRHETAEVTPT